MSKGLTRATFLKFAVLFLALAELSTGASPTFTVQTYPAQPGLSSGTFADLNADGLQDLVSVGPPTNTITRFLATGHGGFQAGVAIGVPVEGSKVARLATTDLDRDGKTDIVVANGTTALIVFYGNGDGTFVRQDYPFPEGFLDQALASDFNRDGKPDIVVSRNSNAGGQLWFIAGTGTRTLGLRNVIYSELGRGVVEIMTGDFDGDARADLWVYHGMCLPSAPCDWNTAVMYGDGLGGFGIFRRLYALDFALSTADVNKDGRSDVLATQAVINDFGRMVIRYGRGTRTAEFATQTINLDFFHYPQSPQVADFNGDGKNDVGVLVNKTCSTCFGDYDHEARFYDGASNFSTYTTVFLPSDNDSIFGLTAALDLDPLDGNKKPDLVTTRMNEGTFKSIINTTTTGTWSTCPDLASAEAIHICGPAAGAIFSGGVRFSVAANSFNRIRKLEIWVNGTKRSETYNTYAHDAWVDTTLSLPNGTYTGTVIAAGYDNRLFRKSVSFAVQCPAPSTSTGVVICTPANGSTVGTSVTAQARGGSAVTFMELWVDGTKRFQNSGNNISTSMSLPPGRHKMTVFGKNNTGVIGSAVSFFTVQ